MIPMTAVPVSDTITFASATDDVTVDLSAGMANGSEIGTDTLTEIENVIGGAGNDTITGDDADNRLEGGRATTCWMVVRATTCCWVAPVMTY